MSIELLTIDEQYMECPICGSSMEYDDFFGKDVCIECTYPTGDNN